MSLHIGIIPGGKVILPLLALGGIAVWINYYYRKRRTSNQEEVSAKSDLYEFGTKTLRGVRLTSGHLEGILSSCSNLKKLTIEDSKLPYKLRLAGTVTTVVILECVGGKEIDLPAAYLRRFAWSDELLPDREPHRDEDVQKP
ncbi:hypothetical protein T459_13205 [Capsicum annuum]|uniref:Uncharacterized protein n=1 Tax=Capsicum annuum TaxID=4072 RepID=A0A2G2ZS07_CAPAN|nr:hypothetical protein T459_13205 [Capsicum annuum]